MKNWIRAVLGAALIGVAGLLAVACGQDPAQQAADHLSRGNGYFDQKQFKEAMIEYKNVLQLNPQHGQARSRLAESHVQTGDSANGFREYVRAADLLPSDEALQVKVTSLLLVAGRFEDAKTRAEKVLALNPKNAAAQILLGNATAGLKDLDGAVRELEEAVHMDPTRSAGYANLGALQMARGKIDDAESAFRRAIEIEPTSVTAHLAAANFFWAANRNDDAVRELKAALALEPKNLLTNRALAMFSIVSDKVAEAEPYVKTMAEVSKDSAGRMVLADYYRSLGRDDDAMRVLRELSRDDSARVEALVRIASLQLRAQKQAAALGLLEEALAKQPTDGAARTLKATILLIQQQAEPALAEAQAAVTANPTYAPGYYALGLVQRARRDNEAARQAFEDVVRLSPRAQEARLQLAQLHLAAGRIEKATTLARDVLAANAQNPTARLLFARGQLARGELADAERTVASLVEDLPDAADVHALNGSLQYAKKNIAGARAAFTRVLALAPEDIGATQALVMLDLQAKDTAAARNRIDARLKNSPNDARVLLLAGRTYGASGDAAAAERHLRQAVAADPSYIDAYAALSQLYVGMGKLEQARAEFSEIVKRQPRSVAAHTMLGMLLELDGKPAEAEKRYEAALAIDDRAAVPANNLAWILADSGRDLNRALTLAQTAHAWITDNSQIQDTLGWVYFKKEMYPQAVDTLQQAAKANATNPLIQYHLGMAAVRHGDHPRGISALREALRLNPKFEMAADARKTLAQLSR